MIQAYLDRKKFFQGAVVCVTPTIASATVHAKRLS